MCRSRRKETYGFVFVFSHPSNKRTNIELAPRHHFPHSPPTITITSHTPPRASSYECSDARPVERRVDDDRRPPQRAVAVDNPTILSNERSTVHYQIVSGVPLNDDNGFTQ